MKDFGLVVIGAHFGVWLENQINKFKGHNILLVEPVPYNIEILEKKYGKFDNIHICKNPIFSERKTSSFYYVDGKSIHKLGKHWASGIGSFDKNHILNHKSKRFKIEDDDIIKMKMDFITFKDVVDIFSVKSINTLQIDAEGAEYEILKSFNLEIYRPKLFTIEHNFTENELKIDEHLNSHGYVRIFRKLTAFDAWYIPNEIFKVD